MKFEHRVLLVAPREVVWGLMLDIPTVAACVPGVSRVEPASEGGYQGLMGVQIGPIKLNLEGKVTLEAQDKERWEAEYVTAAAERKLGGGLNAKTRLLLLAQDSGTTELVMETDATLLGRLGEFGQPIIRKKADTLLKDFGVNLQKLVVPSSSV